jgi:hypothetical protein
MAQWHLGEENGRRCRRKENSIFQAFIFFRYSQSLNGYSAGKKKVIEN